MTPAMQGVTPSRCERNKRKVGTTADKHHPTVIIDRDESGNYVASVLKLRSCHTQGKSLDEVMERTKEAVLICLEDSFT